MEEIEKGDWESEIWRDPNVSIWRERAGGDKDLDSDWERKRWWRCPCWELGFAEGADEEDDDMDPWSWLGKMDMKILPKTLVLLACGLTPDAFALNFFFFFLRVYYAAPSTRKTTHPSISVVLWHLHRISVRPSVFTI